MTNFASSGRPASTFFDAGSAELRRFALFLCVGLGGLVSDAAVFTALNDAGLSRSAARAVSIALAMLLTFALNRRFTFAATGRRARRDLTRYIGVTVVAQGFSYGLFLTLLAMMPPLPSLVALVTGAVAATVLSFTGQRFFTFRG